MSKLKFDTWENPDGTENFKCRAWVNFNGVGTLAIRGAGNVAFITDNAVGDYTVNFENDMPTINYAYEGSCADGFVDTQTSVPQTTSYIRIRAVSRIDASALVDSTLVSLTIFC